MKHIKQYLEWHGQQWRVRIKVPTALRELLGKSKLVSPLHTSDLDSANALKWPVVAHLKARINEARIVQTSNDPLITEALKHRLYLSEPDADYANLLRAEEIQLQQGYSKAKAFYDIASGTETPLNHLSSSFLTHKVYRQKSEGDFHRVLGWLGEWLSMSQVTVSLQSVTRKVAGEFIVGKLVLGRSDVKANAYLGFLREYWRWLKEKGHTASNPWVDQSLPNRPRAPLDQEPDGGKRPYTDEEMLSLLNGEPEQLIDDLIQISALSGMRGSEIFGLRVADCQSNTFSIKQGKTNAAIRDIPIHTDLEAIVSRRLEGKDDAEYLMEEYPTIPSCRETRGDPAFKKFARYRLKLGLDERPNSKPKSNIEFHSLRRWFSHKARAAMLKGSLGFDEWTIVSVMGHIASERPKSLDLSMLTYAGPDTKNAKRALVQSVKLPINAPHRKGTSDHEQNTD